MRSFTPIALAVCALLLLSVIAGELHKIAYQVTLLTCWEMARQGELCEAAEQ